MIFPSQLYYTKFPIFTRVALPLTGRINPIPFESRLVSPGASSSTNMKPKIWDTGCKPDPWVIFPLQLYYTKFPILTRVAMPVTDRVNPIHFDGRLVSPGNLSSTNKKFQIWDTGVLPVFWMIYRSKQYIMYFLPFRYTRLTNNGSCQVIAGVRIYNISLLFKIKKK